MKTDTPDISLIVTTYNFGLYIEKAIKSLLDQKTKYSFEIIIIDDCSNDDSVLIIESIKDNRIHFIKHQQNVGPASSINEAFSLARGKFIGRFDGDDLWPPNFLETVIPFLEEKPEVGLVYGNVAFIDNKGQIMNPNSPVPNYTILPKIERLKSLLTDYLICAPAILGRRDAWAKALPLPEYLLYCDFELSVNILTEWEIAYIPMPIAYYRLHAQNMHSTAIKNRKTEISIFNTLHRFRQKYPNLISAKDWKDIYNHRYLQLGDQYFGSAQTKDARRCYSLGKAYLQPFSKSGYFRRWLATFLSHEIYNAFKKYIKTHKWIKSS